MKDTKIYVATHKEYQMPADRGYVPIHVGSQGKESINGYELDSTGDNISAKNSGYCELTGLYWAWKNSEANYIGLSHYRRHFTFESRLPKSEEDKFKLVANTKRMEELLDKTGIILPKKRKYYIENLYDHYKNTLYIEPLDVTGQIIEEKYPEYVKEFQMLHKRTSAHMFNMFVMKKEHLDAYCQWLFDILFELEERIDGSQYDAFHGRFYGRISELLLDVWINTNGYQYSEVKVMDMNDIDWFNKISTFLKAKFLKKKYKASFK